MSNSILRSGSSTPRRLLSISLASALFALLALTLSVPRSFANSGFGGAGGDGDSVGSLPGTQGDQFSVTLIGDMAQIDAMIADLKLGETGTYSRESLNSPGLVRVAFGGDVTVELDRALLEASFVAVQLKLGPAFGGGRLQVQSAGANSVTAAVPGSLSLHLQKLSWNGVLEGGVALRATHADGFAGSLGMRFEGAGSERIVLSQVVQD